VVVVAVALSAIGITVAVASNSGDNTTQTQTDTGKKNDGVKTDTGNGQGTKPEAPEPPPADTTVEIDGVLYTCGQLLYQGVKECPENYQAAFNTWGDDIDAYVTSDDLGALGGRMSYEEVATTGLAACLYAYNGEEMTAFTAQLLTVFQAADPTLVAADFDDFWSAAMQHLCTDAFTNPGGENPNPGALRAD